MEQTYFKQKNKLKVSGMKKTGFLISVWFYPIVLFLVLYVYVNFSSIIMAFQKVNLETYEYEWYGFNNFINFFDNLKNADNMQFVLRNSVVVFASNLLFGIPTSVLISYFIYKKIYGAGVLKIALFLPNIVASIVWVTLFKYFSEYALPALMKIFNWDIELRILSDPNKAFWTMLSYALWMGLPSGMLVYLGTMSRIPSTLIEVGKLEGIGLMKELWHVVLPLAFPVISISLITAVPGFFTSQLYIYSFYQDAADYRLYTFGYYLFAQVIGRVEKVQNYPLAAAAGILFTLIAAPLALLVKWALEKFGPDAEF